MAQNFAFWKNMVYTWVSFSFYKIMKTTISSNTIWNPSLVSWKDEKNIVVSAIVDILQTRFALHQKRDTMIAQRYEAILCILAQYHANTISFGQCFASLQPLAYIPWQETVNTYITIINTLNPEVDSHERIFTAISKKLSQLLKSDELYKPLLIDTLAE